MEDALLIKYLLAEMIGVLRTTILNILHQYLGMSKVSTRWVSRMLTPLASCVHNSFWKFVEATQMKF